MVCLRIQAEAGTASRLGRLFESFGCRVVDRTSDELRVGFPQASNEDEAAAEARLYLSMRPPLRGTFRLAPPAASS